MKVTLIEHTQDALNLLLRTKNTRLSYEDDPVDWTEEKKREHLSYMLQSIKSSWEFVSYTFQIEGVTRAFTHELVRTRAASYAQQSMRVIDARHAVVLMPESIEKSPSKSDEWTDAVERVKLAYGWFVDNDVPIQDARGILPTNVLTNIMVKWNLRTLHETAKVRLCTRTAGEYQDVMRAMREQVLIAHPWAEDFIQVHCVAEGTCAFPRYGKAECPVYLPSMDNTRVREQAKAIFWKTRYYAAPVARDGMAVESCAQIGDVIYCRCGNPSSHYGVMGYRGAREVREMTAQSVGRAPMAKDGMAVAPMKITPFKCEECEEEDGNHKETCSHFEDDIPF
jgi:flavin-dependent thymidylate synthase